MREHGVPQFTVDAHRPVGAFDLLGVSLLHRARLHQPAHRARPRRHPAARARTAPTTHPIVIAGGHAAFNPEPIADFLDAAVLGDGEQAVLADHRGRSATGRREGRPGGRDELLLRLAAHRRRLRAPRSTTSTTCPTAGSSASCRTARACRGGSQAHRDGPRRVAVPEAAAGAARRDRARADERGDLPRLHPRLPVLPGRHDHPAGARAEHRRASARWSRRVWPRRASRRSACSRLSSADHSEIADDHQAAWPTATRAPTSGCRCPRTRVDAFNIDLANELSRNGRRSGLTFAPEGGSERMRKVINKMVTEEDLIRTVTAAYGDGWRQVKLYFMCGLPTETDEDVLQIAELASEVIAAGREASGQRDIRCTVTHRRVRAQAAHAVPVGRAAATTRRPTPGCAKLRDAIRARPAVRQGDRLPLPRRQARHRRGAAVPRRPPGRRRDPAVWEDGGRFDGWSEHFSFERWMRCADEALAGEPVDVDWYTTRERDVRRGAARGTTSTPAWTRTGSGRTGRTRCPRSRSRTAAGRRASTAASARRWAPRSRSARPGGAAAADGRPARHGRDRGLTPQSNDQGKVGDHGPCHDPQLFLDRCRTGGGQRRVT